MLVPWLLATTAGDGLSPHPILRIEGLALMSIGLGIFAQCVRLFAQTGRGTPAPWDPPRRLVATGIYRRTRNPMYVAILAFVLGQAVLRESLALAAYAALLATAFHLRVLRYEEPRLARLFGNAYARYRARVPRWLDLSATPAAKAPPASSAAAPHAPHRPPP